MSYNVTASSLRTGTLFCFVLLWSSTDTTECLYKNKLCNLKLMISDSF